MPRPTGSYLQQGQVCVLGQLLQVLHGGRGLDHAHQGRGAVEGQLAQQGLLVTEQQQSVVRAAEQSPRSTNQACTRAPQTLDPREEATERLDRRAVVCPGAFKKPQGLLRPSEKTTGTE